ncbi:MAG: hypothetical protein ACK4VO_10115 [Pseudobdellovibrio sp.]
MEEKIILRESSIEDADKLSHFFSQIPIQGELDVKIKRQVDFFSLYRRLNVKYRSFLLEDELNILGTASFLFSNNILGSKTTKIAYACDLRIASARKAILNWSRHFLPKLQHLIFQERVDHFITSINLDNTQVINSFIRTKQKRSQKPFYELVRKFNLVTIHGFYPLYFKVNPSIKVSYLEKTEHEKFIKYIESKIEKLDLVPELLKESVQKYIQESLIYSFRNFVVAYDEQNNIVGSCYPLSSTLLQDYFPLKYNQQANNFRQFLKLAAWLNIGRRLTRPFSRSQKDETLNFQFLHFLYFEHPDVLKKMIKFTFKHSRQNDFLIYPAEQDRFTYRPPKGTIHTEMNYALYEIRTPESIEKSESPSLRHKLRKSLWLDGFLF